MTLGSKIKDTREKMRLTQSELATRAGISRVSIGNYERDSRIPNSTVLKNIASALYTSPDFLLGDSPYFTEEDRTEEYYFKYMPDYGYDFELEEFLEKHGYSIEPSVFDFQDEEERIIKAEEWSDPEKQYFTITHNKKKIKVSPKEVAEFEQNIMNAIEYEWYKIKQKYKNK